MPTISTYSFRYVYEFHRNGMQDDDEDYYDGYLTIEPDIINKNKSYHSPTIPIPGIYYMFEKSTYQAYPIYSPSYIVAFPKTLINEKRYVGYYLIHRFPVDVIYYPWQVSNSPFLQAVIKASASDWGGLAGAISINSYYDASRSILYQQESMLYEGLSGSTSLGVTRLGLESNSIYVTDYILGSDGLLYHQWHWEAFNPWLPLPAEPTFLTPIRLGPVRA